jgi:integrase
MTFNQCRDGYVADHEKGWSAGHKQDWLATVTNHASPVFGALPVALVDTPLMLRVLRPIWTTKHVTARRLRGFVESVLDWATVNHYRKAEPNPARWKGHLSEILPRTDDVHLVEHRPALPYVDLPELVAGLTARSDSDALCLLLLILTATRVSAATGARAEEFDLANRIWTIPATRMKRRGKRKSLPFRVPLSDAAIAIVARAGVKYSPASTTNRWRRRTVAATSPRTAFVRPSRRGPKTHTRSVTRPRKHTAAAMHANGGRS